MSSIDEPVSAVQEPVAISPERASLQNLFSSLSREVCRPLISIRAGFDLLLAGCEGDISAAQRWQLLGLKGNCDSLIRLTRSFLDHAGAERVARPLDLASFRLAALLDETDRQFSCLARMQGIAWSCGLAGPDARVTTDLACLQQVLGRLVENALANVRGGGSIGVSATAEEGGWVVEVSYAGPSPESTDPGREPSHQLVGCTRPLAAGAGDRFGLAVCRQLAGRLGGEIAARSGPGRQTSILVRFGLASTQAEVPG
jgi:signal transduction histidine kinase